MGSADEVPHISDNLICEMHWHDAVETWQHARAGLAKTDDG
ncbi:MAG: hypothetical protein Q4E42_02350 [Phascolarctobacterium sp.]|nr:hypothetical protein [Phascolarctobacterium sp.]